MHKFIAPLAVAASILGITEPTPKRACRAILPAASHTAVINQHALRCGSIEP